MDYNDGDSLLENLMHRTHRLPDLAGAIVFNPEADADSPMVPCYGPDSGVKSGHKADMKPDGKPGAKSGGKAGAKSGMALKGQRIEVWWAQDEEFYSGVVTSYKKVHLLIVFSISRTQGIEDLSCCCSTNGGRVYMLHTCTQCCLVNACCTVESCRPVENLADLARERAQ